MPVTCPALSSSWAQGCGSKFQSVLKPNSLSVFMLCSYPKNPYIYIYTCIATPSCYISSYILIHFVTSWLFQQILLSKRNFPNWDYQKTTQRSHWVLSNLSLQNTSHLMSRNARSRWCHGTSFAGSIVTQIGSSTPTRRTVLMGLKHPWWLQSFYLKQGGNTFLKEAVVQYVFKRSWWFLIPVMLFRVGPVCLHCFFHNFFVVHWWLGFFLWKSGLLLPVFG